MNKYQHNVAISLDISSSNAHLFRVTMTLSNAQVAQQFSMPSWTPGSYMIREFSQHIVRISASDNQNPIAITKIDKHTFVLANTSSTVSISYDVYAFDSSIRAAYIDDQQAYFNGTAIFLRPLGLEQTGFLLTIKKPQSEEYRHRQIATGMPSIDIDAQGFGSYFSASFQELVDYPVQISEMKYLSWRVQGIDHRMALVGDVRNFNEQRFVADLTKLCDHLILLFGRANFSSYLFIARFEENNYGGLEHRNSSMLVASPYGLPHGSNDDEASLAYRTFLGLCAHEYIHAWIIKWLRPKAFINYDLDREIYTNLLWLFEGITSYYDDLCLPRSQVISPASYLDLMSKNYSRLLRNFGRKQQSLSEASFDAWIKFYRPNENTNNTGTSYYLKGSFLGMYLDLMIRNNTNEERSLDDVMREAITRFGDTGIDDTEFYALLKEMGNIDSDDLRERFIDGVEELPIEDMLAQVGVDVKITDDDLYLDDKTKMKAYLGMKIKWEDRAAIVVHTDTMGPAMNAGLSAFDEIVAINSIRLVEANAAELLMSIEPGKYVDVSFARKRHMRTVTVRADSLLPLQAKFLVRETARQEEKRRLHNWLSDPI